jgi:hypothetical protein
MPPLYVSFFTPAYAEEAAGLVASLDALGLPHHVRAVRDRGRWAANCGLKAAFIAAEMELNPGRPVVWLDADARVRQRPALFDAIDCDLAAHWRHGVELLSGTLYIAPTDAARDLLSRWNRRCEAAPEVWDQVNLADVVREMGDGLRVVDLPASYTRIFDDPKMGEPVIEHMQASRRLRHACASPS